MPHFTEISVTACHSALPPLLDWLAGQCSRLDIAAGDCQRLQLLTEELFINAVDHGYGEKTDGEIRLGLSCDDGQLRLRHIDSARPFDPSQAPTPCASSEHLGGLGITLLRGMSRELRYRRENQMNIIDILL